MITAYRLPVLLVLVLGSVHTRGGVQGGKVPDPSHTPDALKILFRVLDDDDDGLAETRATPGYKAAYLSWQRYLREHPVSPINKLDPD